MVFSELLVICGALLACKVFHLQVSWGQRDGLCPEKCECGTYRFDKQGAIGTSCYRKRLTHVPQGIPPDTNVLDLGLNHLEILTKDVFKVGLYPVIWLRNWERHPLKKHWCVYIMV